MSTNFQQLANFIWSVADLLRPVYRPPQYERVMLPLIVLRRFDAVLAHSKDAVLKRHAELRNKGIPNIDAILNNLAKDEDGTPLGFHNHSQLDFYKLKGDPDNIGRHLADYINGFSENVRKIFERFLNTCPELFDALLAVQDELGSEPLPDWNHTWDAVQTVFRTLPSTIEGWSKGAKGTAQRKIFRDCFTTVDPEASPVIDKHHKGAPLNRLALFPGQTLPADLGKDDLYRLLGWHADGQGKYIEYEPDPALKDAENIPLKEDIVSYVLREVRPYVADAWIDRETLDEQDGGIGKVGYEINFNRVFFQYQPPRPLHQIDAELAEVEQRILGLLGEVTE